MDFLARVIYIGDENECGFVSGYKYTVKISQAFFGGAIRVTVMHPTTGRPLEGMSAVHPDLYRFLKHWHIMAQMEESS